LQTVSDEALIALYDTAPVIHSFGGTKIVRLSRTLALKGGRAVLPCEAQNMSFASAYTRIPVPKIHRVRNIEHDNGYWGTTCFIVMTMCKGSAWRLAERRWMWLPDLMSLPRLLPWSRNWDLLRY